jgi:aspartate/methionine/tyrosine aminotransferase
MRRNSLLGLIEKHRLLDESICNQRDHFISDWNGAHPFVERFLGPEIAAASSTSGPLRSQYIYFDEQPAVLDAICRLHLKLEGLNLSRENVLAGPGSSSLLVGLSLWLLQQGYTEVFYVPPLYYTLHYFLRLLKIRLRPVSGRHAFEPDSVVNLPSYRSALLLCDPIWYAGRRVPLSTISAIRDWQRKTRSLVLIDGAFQYMRWDGRRNEHSSLLDPELTFRLISPTKSLAIPSFRFAYLLHPKSVHKTLVFLYENIVGGSNAFDLAFAHRALNVLSSDEANTPLTTFLRNTYRCLIHRGLIRTRVTPDCGYFVFGVPTFRLPNQVAMDQDYFELKGYADHVRVNLMLADQTLLRDASTRNGVEEQIHRTRRPKPLVVR